MNVEERVALLESFLIHHRLKCAVTGCTVGPGLLHGCLVHKDGAKYCILHMDHLLPAKLYDTPFLPKERFISVYACDQQCKERIEGEMCATEH